MTCAEGLAKACTASTLLDGSVQVVLIASQWGTAEGGINAFNQPFAKALALVGRGRLEIVCAVTTADAAARRDAEVSGVRLVEVGDAAMGRDDLVGCRLVDSLRQEGIDPAVELWVGHDVKTGFAALAAAAAGGGRVALVHHMNYVSYRNLWGGVGEDTAGRHDEQIDLFSTPGAILFGVGDDLRASVARLGGREAHRIVPGFPEGFLTNSAGHEDLHALVAGRFDEGSEPLKQSRLVAAGLGRAVRMKCTELKVLARPTLTVFGATAETIKNAELEQIARKEAGRIVNVVPTGFDSKRGVQRHLARANLAFMPSVREGFGLIGWEAIGCEVPLILGDQTGLASLLDRELDDHSDRYVTKLTLTGGSLDDRDVEAMAHAIVAVARDLEHARSKAKDLRLLLKDRLDSCTWPAAAEQFIKVFELTPASTSPSARLPPLALSSNPFSGGPTFDVEVVNHKEQCAELDLDGQLGQGNTHRRFDVLATLRFGVTDLAIDGLEISVGVRRAKVRVTSEHGRLVGDRLGEGARAPIGIVASAGGTWELTSPNGCLLRGKVLGYEALCQVETPPNLPAHAKVEVTAARKDLAFDFGQEQPLQAATERVMKIFLENALFQKDTGHLLLSSAEMRKEP